MEATSHRRLVSDEGELSINLDWLASLMDESTETYPVKNKSPSPKIQNVPRRLAQVDSNKNCYVPSVVSIGPYHHGNVDLLAVEKLKPKIAREFASQYGKTVSDISSKFGEISCLARNCYAEGSTVFFDDNAFGKMMFLDGCFILHFIDGKVNGNRKHVEMKRDMLAYVQRDLFLLENQLPFLVLEALMSFMTFQEQDGGIQMLNLFVEQTRALPPSQQRFLFGQSKQRTHPRIAPQRGAPRIERRRNAIKATAFNQTMIGAIITASVKQTKGKRSGSENQKPHQEEEENPSPVHLLDLLHQQLILKSALPTICQLTSPSDWYSYRSVNELKATGIHFKVSETSRFTDVQYEPGFISGDLNLPPMTIDDSTKSILLNLVAYESCPDAPDDSAVTSYICFMDSLIDHAEDVRELRSKGILLNFLGSDQHVADLFNEIGNDLVPNPLLYDSVKGQIEKHYKNTCKIWITEWLHAHFRTPWAFLAFLAAVFAIGLTAVQTYFAAHPPK